MKLKIGTLLLIFILFNSFLLADNIYFGKRNIVWKNSKVISRTDKHVNIQFWERNGTITITKPISSIFGIVESTVDTTSITKIKHFSWDETNIHIKDKSIHSIYYLDQLMGHFNDDIEKEIKLLLESEFTPSDIPQQSNLSGLGLHARNELKTIYNFEGLMSDEERISWCRGKGIFGHHLEQWKKDAIALTTLKPGKGKPDETRRLKKEIVGLKKELYRKEKALAETAALLVLKKKADSIWGEPEDD